MHHVADWKKEKVAELEDLTNSHEIIGIVNLADIPAKQLQTMRKSLGDNAILKMSRKNFIKIALENSDKEEVEGLADYLEGQPAMVFTKMNPFKLFKILEDSKTEAPAKAGSTGSIAPADIVVPAGDTSFPPGPILGELQQVGIPAKIDKGSIVVTDDAKIVDEGEEIPKAVADILTKLEIHPMEVGIDLLAVCEGDTIYTADVLAIDEEETIQTLANAYQSAINLSVYAGILAPLLIQKAARDALNLAINANILTSETTDKILSKAYAQMLAVAKLLSSEAIDDELNEKLNSQAAAAPVAVEDNTEEPEEEEEEEEDAAESAAAGLGALFG